MDKPRNNPSSPRNFSLFQSLPTEPSLSSDETIATIRQPQIRSAIQMATALYQRHDFSSEDTLSSDETIGQIFTSTAANSAQLPSTPPILVNRPVSSSLLNAKALKDRVVRACDRNNQAQLEALIFKSAANDINLSDLSSPLIANTIHWQLQFAQTHAPGAAAAIDTKVIKRMLDLGARANTPNDSDQRFSPLWMALQQTNHEVVKLLLEYGCDPNSSSALTTAAKIGAHNHMQVLLQYGANPNQPQDGKYPLNEACLRGDIAMAKCLLKSGAKIHEDGAAMTALMSACISGNAELCALLVQSGARQHNPTPDQFANFALHLAEQYKDSDIDEFLAGVSQIMTNINDGNTDNDPSVILSFAAVNFEHEKPTDEQFNSHNQKLARDFCRNFILLQTCFSSASAGSTQLEKTQVLIKKILSDDRLALELRDLLAAAVTRRDGKPFRRDD